MTIIQQFPDVSLQMRNKLALRQRKHRKEKIPIERHTGIDRGITLFYDNEFKKWHYKLGLIIVLTIACLYTFIFAVSGIFQWVVINQNSSH